MTVPTLVVLCPVLNRPHRIAPLVRSFQDSLADENVEAAMMFLVNTDDEREIAELRARNVWFEIVPWPNAPHDYPLKMNWGVKHTSSDWILLGADDIVFHPGWFRAAVNAHIRTGKLVIGTNDMVNPLVTAGKHATHPLVHRDYLKFGTIDNPDVLLHPGYHHNSCDVELVETAISRDQFAFAHDSLVEHMHPTFRREVARDDTYRKGIAYASRDRQLCQKRRRLWNPDAPRPQPERRTLSRHRRPSPASYWPPR